MIKLDFTEVYLHSYVSLYESGDSVLIASFAGASEAVKSALATIATGDGVRAGRYYVTGSYSSYRQFIKKLPSSFTHGMVLSEMLWTRNNYAIYKEGGKIDSFYRKLARSTDVPLMEGWKESLYREFERRELIYHLDSYGPYRGLCVTVPDDQEMLDIIRSCVTADNQQTIPVWEGGV